MSTDQQRDDSDRLRGRQDQTLRLRVWSADPCCAKCRSLTKYPDGFELDHRQPLFDGGVADDSNLQVLCVYTDIQGRKHGCHQDLSGGLV